MLTSKVLDTTYPKGANYYQHQRDLIDLTYKLVGKDPDTRVDSTGITNTNVYFVVAPIVEYTIATGFSPGVATSVAFKTSARRKTNTSSFLGGFKYTTRQQTIIPIQSSVWSAGNKYNFLGDWRFLNYPQDTYGFGGYTTLNDKYTVNYRYIRFYEYALRSVAKSFYVGGGYQLDHHWRITELDVPPGVVTDYRKYGFSDHSTSSGIALDILYDTRESAIYPEGGDMYANIQFLTDLTFLGADHAYNSVLIDVRRYLGLPHHTLLAFWFYSVLTLNGNPPYLDLPGTGNDTYNNTGRGYEQGRFIGKKMVDLEAEYRFGITRNGLVGGVVFCNAESLSELASNRFEVISPGFGIGLRIKLNKFSNTNACIDYGIGTKGSRGFAGNLGEVF
ncbi:BamA/TamA family outer membrane protein [Dinghuibacter silviterrae]|uniref:hypothetical protein n=1 Tax=Dinghuibacter silviterrae TaxID=1539049 RepID=UPI0010638D9D|nr:hypothetical protein [Dinghuibacter silviterrae]